MMKKIISFVCAILCIGMANAQWVNDVKANTLISESGKYHCAHVKAAEAPNGNIFVSWLSYEGIGEGDGAYSQAVIKMQVLDKKGNALLDKGGIYISKHPAATWSTDISMTITSDNCAIIAFSDSRTEPELKTHFKTYIYKMDQNGNFLWGLNGIALPTNSTECYRPKICITNSGTIIVGYTDNQLGTFVMNRLDQDGQFVWDGSLSINGIQGNFVACEEDDFIVMTLGKDDNLLTAYRFDAYGDEQWNRKISNDPVYPYVEPVVKSDGENGAIVSFMIGGEGAQEFYVCIQRVNANGETMMGIRPIKTSDEIALHNGVAFGVDTNTESSAIVSLWQKYVQGVNTLLVTKIDYFGDRVWDQSIIELKDNGMWEFSPEDVIITEDGGSILFYRESMDAVNSIVKAQKLDKTGTEVWIKEMSDYSNKNDFAIAPGKDQICVFWTDTRNSEQKFEGEVYGQNITYNGEFGDITSIKNTQASDTNYAYYDNQSRTLTISIADINSVDLEIYSISGLLLNRYNNLLINGNKGNLRVNLIPGTYILKATYGNNQNLHKKIMVK